MGEAKIKSKKKSAILEGEPRCIYCVAPPTTLEHMPPRSMFKAKQRPSGFEFAACSECNSRTSPADLVAAYFARYGAHEKPGDWAFDESIAMEGKMRTSAPGVLEELHDPQRAKDVWVRNRLGILEPMKAVQADGPVLAAYLSVFAAKLGMAMYREHVKTALPTSGGVESLWFLNGGMTEAILLSLLEELPSYEHLRQGAFNSHSQFDYRYTTDQSTFVAGLARLQMGMHIFFISACAPDEIGIGRRLPGSTFIRPGELVGRIPQPIRRRKNS